MILSFFIGKSFSSAQKLGLSCENISNCKEIGLAIQYKSIEKLDWKNNLPQDHKILVFYEVTESDPQTEITLIKEIQQYNSRIQWVLLVDSKIDYFEIAAVYKIGNILKKDKFDTSVIRALTIRLMTGQIFGFAPYFLKDYQVGPIEKVVKGTAVIKDLMSDFESNFLKYVDIKDNYRLRTYFYELLINTITYSIVGISSEIRDTGEYSIPSHIQIPERKKFKIAMVMDDEKYGISVMDTSGTLSLERVLEKLRRQSRIGKEELPPGMWDLTGRGLSLILKDNRLIINIIKNEATEIIFLHYREEYFNKYESVIITELLPH